MENQETRNIAYVRPEVSSMYHRWELVRDCVDGEESVKARGESYLPKPNPTDTSEANSKRYEQYLKRAVFYNVTGRTLAGLVGQVMYRDPVETLPNSMLFLSDDCDGSGISLRQQTSRSLESVLCCGRSGLLVDYPSIEAPATKAQTDSGYIRPVIIAYQPEQIINWRTQVIGSKKVLSLVVLKESYAISDDGFEIKHGNQYRVLQLINGIYTVSIYHRSTAQEKSFLLVSQSTPKKADGSFFRYIPFTFIGSVNNDDVIDNSPLYDLAILNIAHYRNSADYEESCFMVGQPTPVFTGLDDVWVKEVLEGKVELGSKGGVMLPAGGNAILLQASPNTICFEAMKSKERQMVALGAKLVEQQSVQRTATEANLENASESSILGKCASNVGEAYTNALRWAADFIDMRIDQSEIYYELNTDFNSAYLSAQDQAQLVASWQAGAISRSEMRDKFRKAGIAYLSDEDYIEEIEADASTSVARYIQSDLPMNDGEDGQNGES